MCSFYSKIITIIALVGLVSADSHWGYPDLDAGEDFSKWGGFCESGRLQSPIDLRLDDSLRGYFPNLEFKGYHKSQDGFIINNGHTVQIFNLTNKMVLTKGPLEDDYLLEQIHVHWWSEHTISKVRYALEVHIVHRNKRYPDMTVAAGHKEGIAVLAVLYHMSNEENPGVKLIVESLDQVKSYEHIDKPFPLKESIKVDKLFPRVNGYFTYPGSLTTPNCAESVRWIVLQETFPVSAQQIDKFREIEYEHDKKLMNNYRAIQKTFNRPVTSVQNHLSSAVVALPFKALLIAVPLALSLV